MSYTSTFGEIDRQKVFFAIIAFVPYVDAEILGSLPVVRSIIPVEPIYVLELSWTERARLGGFMLIPVIDGEILELFGVSVNEVISD